mmetsp:Transcript_16246/g.41484  ORF Transcript_16246/g.41484 Transcript_16246/m.41484 type:complete len:90 (+) Transcript_16246:676-945(+)
MATDEIEVNGPAADDGLAFGNDTSPDPATGRGPLDRGAEDGGSSDNASDPGLLELSEGVFENLLAFLRFSGDSMMITFSNISALLSNSM